jgi:hypothetical protein
VQDSLPKTFLKDGAVLIKGLLNKGRLVRCREIYDWAVANLGPLALRMFEGTEQQSHADNANPVAKSWSSASLVTMRPSSHCRLTLLLTPPTGHRLHQRASVPE